MKTKQKIMAILLTILLLGTNLINLGTAVIAANVPEQNNKTNNSNVTFDSYLEGGVHSQNYKVGEETKLYLKIGVHNAGYLKNSVINIAENANYEIDTSNLQNNELIQSSTNNQIKLKQIDSENNVEIVLPIKIKSANQVDKDFIEKESEVSFIAIYVDGNGNEKTVNKVITNKLTWEAELELDLNTEVTKYIPFNQNENYGVLIQTKIISRLKDHVLPVSSTELLVNVPELEGEKPQSVNVIANTTTNTNQDENGKNFNSSNYEYNQEQGTLIIKTLNEEDQNGKIANNSEGQDEYIVNFIYTGQEIYEKAIENGIESEANVNAKLTLASTESQVIEASSKITYNEKETKGVLTDINVKVAPSISKGNLYTNFDRKDEEKEEISYDVTYKAGVNSESLVDQIKFMVEPENYVDKYENTFPVENGSYIKEVKIEKSIFEKILGAEGSIEISKADGTVIGTINTNPEVVDEYLNLNLAELNLNKIQVKTSKPVATGNIEIILQKALAKNQNYSKIQIQEFTKLQLQTTNQTTSEEIKQTSEIALTEPVSKAELSVPEENKNLSTIVEKSNIELRVILNTANDQNALYKNPVLEIELPKQIEKVNLDSVNLLLDKELKIKDKKVISKEGKQVIRITLEGTQTTYNTSAVSNGANIVIKANVIVNKFAASSTEEVVLYYTNQNTNLYETSNEEQTKGIAKAELNIVAPTGVAVVNKITGYDNKNSEILTMNQDSKEATIDMHSSKKEITIEGLISNNYKNSVNNMSVLGRVPFEGNKEVDGKDLGSTFTAPMTSKINLTGIENKNVKIYYSTNGEATTSLESEENNWTENPSNLSEVKSYLINIEGEVEKSSQIAFNYNAEVPENLSPASSTYETYKVFYENKAQGTPINETKVSGAVGVATESVPELEVTLSADKEDNSKVTERQIVTFKAEIKNIGEQEAKNVVLNVPVPQGTTYMSGTGEETTATISVENIAVAETKTVTYQLKVNDLAEEQESGTIKTKVNVTADDLETSVESNEYTLQVISGKIDVDLKVDRESGAILTEGDHVGITLYVTALQNSKNVEISMDIPSSFNIASTNYYDANMELKNDAVKVQNGKLLINIESLETNAFIILDIELEVKSFEGELKLVASVTADGLEQQLSKEYIYNAKLPSFEISQTQTTEKYVKETENSIYEFTIKNTSSINATEVTFEDILPQGLNLEKFEYTYDGETIELDPNPDNTASIAWPVFKAGLTAKVKVTAVASLLPNQQEDITLENKATLSGTGFDTITSNSVQTIIEYNQDLHKAEGETSNGTYKITGTAWLDENKNGTKDEGEQILSGIKVLLIEANSSNTIKEIKSQNEKSTITSENGSYEFDNLPNGNYIVVFCYDASKYNITDYQKSGVGVSTNSDAISMLVTLDGSLTYVGISDTIKITNSNVRDIDIGLYVAEKFDLKLDKYISKITLVKEEGTKVYNLDNSKIEKIEVYNRHIGKSSLIIEYKIVVTNEGKVPGYVRKIVDYMPEGTRFNSELNTDWYISDSNGTAYNNSLENTILNPGESKEVKLVLSAQITSKLIGNLINNNAEIYESYNDQGIPDMDSSTANMVQTEDDMSEANIVVSMATGTVVLYISLALAVLLILLVGATLIKQKIIDKKTIGI